MMMCSCARYGPWLGIVFLARFHGVKCNSMCAADSVIAHAQIAWSAYLSNLSSVRLRSTGHGHF